MSETTGLGVGNPFGRREGAQIKAQGAAEAAEAGKLIAALDATAEEWTSRARGPLRAVEATDRAAEKEANRMNAQIRAQEEARGIYEKPITAGEKAAANAAIVQAVTEIKNGSK